MSTEIGTPQHVVDALAVIAAHLRDQGLAECTVAASGGAAFRLTRWADELLAGWQAERDALRAACEAAQGILWMAEAYAQGGGSHGPEMADYDVAAVALSAALENTA